MTEKIEKREYLSKIVNGELKNPTHETIRKIAKDLDISFGELLDEQNSTGSSTALKGNNY